MPTVSILLAVYNGATTIDRALLSIENQTFRDFETILLDDGSVDDTAKIAERYPFVRVIRQDRRGVAATRQRLIEEARGDWVAFLDHDDEYVPRMLKKLLAATDDKTVLVHGDKQIIVPGKAAFTPKWIPKQDATNLDHLLPDNQISTCSVLVRREAMLKVGFTPTLDKAEDWLAWFRLAPMGAFRYVPEIVAKVHKRPDSVSRPGLDWYQAERQVLEAHVLPNFERWFGDLPEPTKQRFRKIIRHKLGVIASLEAACLDVAGQKIQARNKHREALRNAPTKGAILRFLRHLVS